MWSQLDICDDLSSDADLYIKQTITHSNFTLDTDSPAV